MAIGAVQLGVGLLHQTRPHLPPVDKELELLLFNKRCPNLSSLWTKRSFPFMVGRKSSTTTSTQEPYCQNLKWKMPA